MVRILFVMLFALTVQSISATPAKAQQGPFPGEIVGAWCTTTTHSIGGFIIRPATFQLIGGEPEPITHWDTRGSTYFIGVGNYSNFGGGPCIPA